MIAHLPCLKTAAITYRAYLVRYVRSCDHEDLAAGRGPCRCGRCVVCEARAILIDHHAGEEVVERMAELEAEADELRRDRELVIGQRDALAAQLAAQALWSTPEARRFVHGVEPVA